MCATRLTRVGSLGGRPIRSGRCSDSRASARSIRCFLLSSDIEVSPVEWRCVSWRRWFATSSCYRGSPRLDRDRAPPTARKRTTPTRTSRTLEDAQRVARERHGECLSGSYVNSTTNLLWKCSEGHEWAATYASIAWRGSWCPYCFGNARFTLEFVKEWASRHGIECLSTEYVNSRYDLHWRCPEGHEWRAPFRYVRHHRQTAKCPRCRESRRMWVIDDLRLAAHDRGGQCLTEAYRDTRTPMRWRCAEGHEWTAPFENIVRKGCWCPSCSGHGRLRLHEARALAAANGGDCLSSTYVSARGLLKWRCSAGHEWNAALHRARRAWCRKCAHVPRERIFRVAQLPRENELTPQSVESYVNAVLPTLAVGDAANLGAMGRTYTPRLVQAHLKERGLFVCGYTKRVCATQDMVSSCRGQRRTLSREGKRRSELVANAVARARTRGFPYDKQMLFEVAIGDLPTLFLGEQYAHQNSGGGSDGRLLLNTLSIDRIVPSLGYVRGNVRFLPFWLNRCMQDATDEDALLVFQRMAGIAPPVMGGQIHYDFLTDEQRARLRLKMYHASYRARASNWRLLSELPLPRVCPFTGLVMEWFAEGFARANSASLDHIDPKKGGCSENLRWISLMANRMKGNYRDSDHEHTARAIEHLFTDEFWDTHIPRCSRLP